MSAKQASTINKLWCTAFLPCNIKFLKVFVLFLSLFELYWTAVGITNNVNNDFVYHIYVQSRIIYASIETCVYIVSSVFICYIRNLY